eukprot:m.121156 g.121156  ORF g.121156 m.121156 type:complete len:60 (+) comp14382_c0_seq3:151-330(+)
MIKFTELIRDQFTFWLCIPSNVLQPPCDDILKLEQAFEDHHTIVSNQYLWRNFEGYRNP